MRYWPRAIVSDGIECAAFDASVSDGRARRVRAKVRDGPDALAIDA
jgi:hypothetical protein